MSTQNPLHILIVDDDSNHLKTLQTIVRSWGYQVSVVDDGAKAVENVKERPFALILMDVRMAQMSGIEALRRIKQYNPAIPILIMTAYSSVDSAVEALKAGAYDYLTKPLDFEVLKISLARALEHSGLKAENATLKSKLGADYELENIIGKSRPMKKLSRHAGHGRPFGGNRVDHRRKRDGKRADRQIHPSQQPAQGPSAGGGQLRGAHRNIAGIRAFRP